MDWLEAVVRLQGANEIGVLATLAQVRGHAPRDAGAKMVVSQTRLWGTIGGGNFEAGVIDRARSIMESGSSESELMTFALNDKAANTHGVQCCGGEVKVLLEILNPRQTVAIFGMGHVGYEIAHILARQPVNLILVDSRQNAIAQERIEPLTTGLAFVSVRHEPAPEIVIRDLPAGSTVLVLTHDHAEDLLLCEAALRTEPSYIGLIGSRSKWVHFRKRLMDEGYEGSDIDRITCPIGVSTIAGKDPSSIAVGVAADLLFRWANPAQLLHQTHQDEMA